MADQQRSQLDFEEENQRPGKSRAALSQPVPRTQGLSMARDFKSVELSTEQQTGHTPNLCCPPAPDIDGEENKTLFKL